MNIKEAAADQFHRVYMLVLWAVLTCAAAIVALYGVIWARDPMRQQVVLPTALVMATSAMAFMTLWLARDLIEHHRRQPMRRHVRKIGLLSDPAVWALICAAGLCTFSVRYVRDANQQVHFDQLAMFWRASDLTSGVSILVPLCLLFSALYVWCTWNTKRMKMQTYDRSESAVILDLLTGRDPEVEPKRGRNRGAFRRQLRWTMSEIAPWDRLGTLWWTVPAGLAVVLLSFAPNPFTTVDGRAASWLLWWCSVCGLVLGADAIARSADQAYVLLEALRRLKTHPVSSAFSRIVSKPLDWRLRLSPLRRLALAPLIADMRTLESKFQRLSMFSFPESEKVTFPDLEDKGSLSDWDAATPMMATEQWAAIRRGVESLYALLAEQKWTFAARAFADTDKDRASVLDASEDMVAYYTAFVLRNLLARAIAGLSAGLLVIGLVGAAHLLYPFQGRHFWLTVDLAAFLCAAAIACVILLRFERDAILSILWEKTPGRINWTSGFVYRIAITAAIPTFLVISSFFPEVAGSLATMIEPLQKALP